MSMYVVSHKNVDLTLSSDYYIIAVGNAKEQVLRKTFSDVKDDNIAHKNS